MLLSMVICHALVDECKVTKDWAISRYDIIEKSYEMHPQIAAEQKNPHQLLAKEKLMEK